MMIVLLCLTPCITARAQEADGIAQEGEMASRFLITVRYDSPVADRGRDNGVRLYGLSPAIRYDHRSGVFGSVSGSWLDKTEDNWDVTTASLGFGRSIGDEWSGSVAYTHLWFSTTSPQARSVLDNSLDLELGWSGTYLTASTHLLCSFSTSSEISLFLSVSAPLTLHDGGGSGSLEFEPGLTGVFGQQDALLEQARQQKTNNANSKSNGNSKKNGAISTITTVSTRKTFSVMVYEVNLPLRYRWKACTVGASYTIAAPLNIVDDSGGGIFGILGLEVSMTIR